MMLHFFIPLKTREAAAFFCKCNLNVIKNRKEIQEFKE